MDSESIKAKLEFDQITINQKNIEEFDKLKPSSLNFIYITVAFILIMISPMFISIEIDLFTAITVISFNFSLIIYGLNRDTNRRIDLLIEIIRKQRKNT